MYSTYKIFRTLLICLLLFWSAQSLAQENCYAAGTSLSFPASGGTQVSDIQGGCFDGSTFQFQIGTKPNWISAYPNGTQSVTVVASQNTEGTSRSGSVQLVKNGSQIGVFSVSQDAGIVTVGQVSITSGPTQRCNVGNTDYNAVAANATSYVWSLSPLSAGTINNNGNVAWNGSSFGTVTVQVTAYGPNNSSSTATRSVTFTGVSTPGLQSNVSQICTGGPATLTLGPLENNVTYQLYRNNSQTGMPVDGSEGFAEWNVNNGGTYSVEARQNGGLGCIFRYGSLTIIEKSGLGNPILSDPGTACNGLSTPLTITTSGSITNNYEWSLTNAGSSTISSSGASATVDWHTGFSGTATVTVQATSECGTSSTLTRSITVTDPIIWHLDTDGDGYPDKDVPTEEGCSPPSNGNWTQNPNTVPDSCPNYFNDDIGTNGCNPDCLYSECSGNPGSCAPFVVNPGSLAFESIGGTLTAEVEIGCNSGYNIEIEPISNNADNWLTVTLINGNVLQVQCEAGTEVRQTSVNVRVNGNSGGGLQVTRNASDPPDPDNCQVNPIQNIMLSALGDSQQITVSFVDQTGCNGSFALEHPYNDNVAGWLTITPDGLSYTFSVGANDTGNSLTTPLIVTQDDGTGTGNRIPVNGGGFTVTQASCLTGWFPDRDNDGLGDANACPVVSCTIPQSEPGIVWVANSDDRCPLEFGTLANQGCPVGQVPENFNTITVKGYDITQNLKVASKGYFNELGRPIQNQTWNIRTNDTWASEVLYDNYGRPALQTLSAPIRSGNSFSYKTGFVKNGDTNNDYTTADFTGDNTESPSPIGEDQNTLGWYFSEQNDRETYQDVSDYPFIKTTYSDLMPGSALRTIAGNKYDTNKDGNIGVSDSWPQNYTFTMRASEELSQSNAFNDSQYDAIEIIKTVNRDVHGVENVLFKDLDGKILAKARSGGTQSPVSMTISIGEQGYVDIHVPQGTTGFNIDAPNFSISGPNITVHDLITELTVSVDQTATLPPGFYRVSINYLETFYNPNNPVVITYKVNYFDYSLIEYDEANRLKTSYQPIVDSNGDRLKTNYFYDNLDRLIKVEKPESGITEYIYRQDGQIRFSQNSKQREVNEVSFTNYDYLGRPIKSGVWMNANFASLDNTSIVIELSTREVIETEFDAVPDIDNTLQTLGQTYQTPSFLSGNVARTKSDNTTTYYSYDIYGRVKWIVQDIVDIGIKTIDYKYYPITGLVSNIDFQKDISDERFVHHYFYNSSNQLIRVETSKDRTDNVVHAEYEYYENGALKRTELAGVQGVDYVYNLAGQLKAINHPGQSEEQDPGKDGSIASGTQVDLFGMQLDYHNNDYNRAVDNIKALSYGEDLFNGNIKGARWNSGVNSTGTTNEQLYAYSYDRNNWLTEANYAQYNSNDTGDVDALVDDIGVYNSGDVENKEATTSITLKEPFHAQSGSMYSAKIIQGSGIQEVGNGDYDVTGIEYDANGNIKKLTRNKNTINGENSMDELEYEYYQDATNGLNSGTPNQLQHVSDAVTRNTEADDIKGQSGNNYSYNAVGELTNNLSEEISYFYNTVGLVTEVKKENKTLVKFHYNDRNHRVKKERFLPDDGVTLLGTTYYVRDIQGMPTAIYSKAPSTAVKLIEHSLYGSSRIGVYKRGDNGMDISYYELTDHLGNVRAVFSENSTSTVNESFANYFPFGMQMPGPNNSLNSTAYRYAFQGQEKDAETGKEAFELRLWDSRIGRWLATDPAGQYNSPYLGIGNDPINGVDLDGDWKTKWAAQLWKSLNGGGKVIGIEGNYSVEQMGDDGIPVYISNYTNRKHSFNPIKQAYNNLTTLDNAYFWTQENVYVDVNGSTSIGVQVGVKTPFGSLGGGVLTSEIGQLGLSTEDGAYADWGDGTSHNFIEGKVKVLDKKLALGGKIDYVTPTAPPEGVDILEFYTSENNKLHWDVSAGPGKSYGPGLPGGLSGGKVSSKLNANGKNISIGGGFQFIFGAKFNITVGIKDK